MVPWWLLVLLAFAAEYSTGTDERKIHGGREAKDGEYPYVVFVGYFGSYLGSCGGTIATLSRIITAGHCFFNKETALDASKYKIYGGSVLSLNPHESKQERKLVKYKVHEGYKKKLDDSNYHDIAVGELDRPFEQSNTLSIMKVASLNEEENKQAWDNIVKAGKHCSAVGWGHTESKKATADILKTADVKFVPDAECKPYPGDVSMAGKGEACAYQVKPGEGICDGDSGSPFICDGYVFGMTRSKVECGSAKRQLFLLFWPYLNYFQLSASGPNSESAANSTGSYNFKPSLICLTTILTISIL